jgi:outer membrane protein OmpA-like peptidoglycan-associated protein
VFNYNNAERFFNPIQFLNLTKKNEKLCTPLFPWKLQISGHTDNVGDDDSNLILSKKRAEAVKNYLITKGIATERLMVEYFGETKPVADNTTSEGRAKNRRVEMKIVIE